MFAVVYIDGVELVIATVFGAAPEDEDGNCEGPKAHIEEADCEKDDAIDPFKAVRRDEIGD